MDLVGALSSIRELRDQPVLAAALGCEPQWIRTAEGAIVVGQRGDFPWLALENAAAERMARAHARV